MTIEQEISKAKAALDRLRAAGIDGPVLWAAEGKVDALLDVYIVMRTG